MTPTTTPAPSRREQLKARQQAETQRDKRRRTWTRIIGALVTVIVVAVVGYGLWTAIPEQGDTQRLAPDFTLTTTAGTSVTLSDQRPNPVLIYFNEGAGCASCTMQMAEIEKNPGFAEAGIEVLPIVMNSADQILPDLQTGPCRRRTTSSTRACTPGCPVTASSSSTATASNAGMATTPPCGSTPKSSSTRSPPASSDALGVHRISPAGVVRSSFREHHYVSSPAG
jgi:hypothetical protein